ncbi:MAG: alcohol dehydrogenase catalytic domain-containing protein [Acidimicrobiia bacterium]|nr:alcohol dehydrogenase catalytic domain-containing protein [Acidimicrobiia bacterium]
MLSARWTAEGIDVVDVEPPPIPEGWVRLEVTGCGICGSDLHIFRGMRAGTLEPAEFAIPGHEFAGTLVSLPASMADTVYAVEPWVNCRDCAHCLRGDTVLCEDGELIGISAGGGLASFVDVPLRLLHPVDAAVDPTLASLAEPWAVSVRAVHRARLTELDERVLIIGGGNIGLLAGLAARDRAATVGITCRYPHQADLARRFGLDAIAETDLDAWADAHQPGVVIETVGGEADTMADAVRCVRRGGRVVVVGVFDQPRPTDYREVVLKELELIGSFIYGTVESGSEFGAAVGRMGSISDELAALQTHHFALTDLVEAFATANDKSSLAVKVTIGGEA